MADVIVPEVKNALPTPVVSVVASDRLSIMTKVQTLLAATYAKKTRQDVNAIPTDILSILMNLLTSVLAGCGGTGANDLASLQMLITNHPVFAQWRVRNVMTSQGLGRRSDAQAMIETILEAPMQPQVTQDDYAALSDAISYFI